MRQFLANNCDELIARCNSKVARRPQTGASDKQLSNGIPLFLGQLQRTLRAEESGHDDQSFDLSSGSRGFAGHDLMPCEMAQSAAAHGKELLESGFSVEQVVHEYGDLFQAITDLAVQRDVAFTTGEFRTLNRCLDNAIANAVTAFGFEHDFINASSQLAAEKERHGFLAHELHNSLALATLAVGALETGNMPIASPMGCLLKRSLNGLGVHIDRALGEQDVQACAQAPHPLCSLPQS